MLKKIEQTLQQPAAIWSLVVLGFLIAYIPFAIDNGWNYKEIPSIDLPSFYTASVNIFQHGRSPYNPTELGLFHDGTVYPYLYPPPSLLLFFPLSKISYGTAQLAVLIFNHLLVILLAWQIPVAIFKLSPKQNPALFIFWFLYVFTFYPAISTIIHGQFNFLLLEFLILYLILARKGKTVWAAFFLTLAILLKTYPIILVPLLFLINRRRDAIYTIAWLGVITLFSMLSLPASVWQEWFVNVLPTGGYASIPEGLFSPAVIWNQGLNGFFARVFHIRDEFSPASSFLQAKVWTYISAILVLAITTIKIWRDKDHTDQPLRAVMVTLPAMYLIAPFSWEHHLAYILPTIFFLFIQGKSINRPWNVAFYGILLICALVLGVQYFVQVKFYAVTMLWMLSMLNGSQNTATASHQAFN